MEFREQAERIFKQVESHDRLGIINMTGCVQ